MSSRLPSILRVRRLSVARRDGVGALVLRTLRPARNAAARIVAAFELCLDEQRFARALLRERTQYWIYRVSQRAFSGDFVLVDMSPPPPSSPVGAGHTSSPELARRRVVVIDLKRGAPVRFGGGGAGAQLRNAARVVEELARTTGVVSTKAPFELATGDGTALLRCLSARASETSP